MRTWFGDECTCLNKKYEDEFGPIKIRRQCSRQHYEDRESLLRISMLGNVKILTRPNEGSFSHENTSSNHEDILHNLGYAT
ncbi:unnamed protein product [Rhizophagus irregularis]|nr:unnamed protein product [Rhizophagus irregularis]